VDKKCLLCVDDDPGILQHRRLLLEGNGYEVVTATSGEDALTILERGAVVDAVLLDYVMPSMNGDELAQRLRNLYPALPLIIVSAVDPLPPSLLQLINARVLKGQDPQILLSTVASVISQAHPEAQPPARAQRTVLCVEDEEFQLKMRTLLFESAGYRVLAARTAGDAMDAFNSSRVDAVVMDYWLCGKDGNGTALAERMKQIRPRTPIVMLSGFSSLPGEGAIVDSWMQKAEAAPESIVSEVGRLIEMRNSSRAKPE